MPIHARTHARTIPPSLCLSVFVSTRVSYVWLLTLNQRHKSRPSKRWALTADTGVVASRYLPCSSYLGAGPEWRYGQERNKITRVTASVNLPPRLFFVCQGWEQIGDCGQPSACTLSRERSSRGLRTVLSLAINTASGLQDELIRSLSRSMLALTYMLNAYYKKRCEFVLLLIISYSRCLRSDIT